MRLSGCTCPNHTMRPTFKCREFSPSDSRWSIGRESKCKSDPKCCYYHSRRREPPGLTLECPLEAETDLWPTENKQAGTYNPRGRILLTT